MIETKNTLGSMIKEIAAKFPDRQAVKFTVMPYERTWKEFDEETDRVAKGLMAMGINKGDHLAIWATNVPEWLQMLFAAAKIGAVIVTVNTNYKIFEMEYLLKQSDSKVLLLIDGFKDSSYVNIMYELCPEIKDAKDGYIKSEKFPYLERVIHCGGNTPTGMLDFKKIEDM